MPEQVGEHVFSAIFPGVSLSDNKTQHLPWLSLRCTVPDGNLRTRELVSTTARLLRMVYSTR